MTPQTANASCSDVPTWLAWVVCIASNLAAWLILLLVYKPFHGIGRFGLNCFIWTNRTDALKELITTGRQSGNRARKILPWCLYRLVALPATNVCFYVAKLQAWLNVQTSAALEIIGARQSRY